MGLCVDLGYEVVSGTHRVYDTPSGIDTFTVTAPTGKKPVSGGLDVGTNANITFNLVKASYPSGDDWVFKFLRDGVNTPSGYVDVAYSVVFIST